MYEYIFQWKFYIPASRRVLFVLSIKGMQTIEQTRMMSENPHKVI